MFGKLLPRDLSRYFQLPLLLKLDYSFFNLIIFVLLVMLPAFPHRLPDLVEPTDNILSNFEFKAIDVLVIDVFDCVSDKLLVDTFAKKRTGLQDEAHLLFCQKFAGGVVLIQQKFPRKIDLVVLIQLSRNLLSSESLKLMGRDEPKSLAYFEEFRVIELVL
jgi:hypothetical protein